MGRPAGTDTFGTERQAPAYRGRDRRTTPVPSTFPVGGLCLGVGLVAIGWGVVIIAFGHLDVSEPVFAVPLDRLDVGASLLASVTAAACFLRWRLEGTASAFWAGLAALVLGCSGFLSSETSAAYVAAGLACSVVTLGLVVVWMRGCEVDASLSVRKVVLLTLVALVGAVATARVLVDHGLAGPALSIGIGVALAGAAYATHTTRSRDRWMTVVLAAYAASYLVYAQVSIVDPMRAAGGTLLHLMAMGIAAFGSTLLLHDAAARQRETAFRLRVERDEAQERFADTLHEVRSTVTALEGGVRTFGPANSDPDQAVLSRALVAEIQRLRALVDDRPTTTPDAETFWVRDVLEPMLTVCVAAGWVVAWDVPADLHAVGHAADVVQVVHALLANAHRHAPDSDIEIAVAREDDYALIRVSDRGPGIAASEREAVFERGNARADSEGRGLGLHIARTIARSQGGDLWVEERPGGGASFVLAVPSVTVLPSAMRERSGAGRSPQPVDDHELRNAQ